MHTMQHPLPAEVTRDSRQLQDCRYTHFGANQALVITLLHVIKISCKTLAQVSTPLVRFLLARVQFSSI
jgi:hypothetical protein